MQYACLLNCSLPPSLSLPPVFQALCLEQLTARELLTRLVEKLSLSLDNVSSLVRLTSTGILVLIDDIVSSTLASTVDLGRGHLHVLPNF